MPSKKRKKAFPLLWVVLIFGLFVVLLGWVYIRYQHIRQARSIHYSAFGIRIPTAYPIHGIDVSHHQGWIDWPSVSAMKVDSVSISFSFIKASEGTSFVDPLFDRNWSGVKRAGLVRGAYHYFRPEQDGLKQANLFIREVSLKPGDLPPVLDIEELNGVSPNQLIKGIQRWTERVEQHYGVKPILYTGTRFYRNYLDGHFPAHQVWIAHYDEPFGPSLNRDWAFWQHSERGRVNGIARNVDFNVFSGSRAEFDQLRVP